jgi:hypothetical protein
MEEEMVYRCATVFIDPVPVVYRGPKKIKIKEINGS